MRFLVRAPDLAFAMWDVFPMARGNGGHSSTRSNAGELPHGPLRRLAALHVELTTWIGGPGLFLHFFHAMHAQTRTVFCDPNRLFLGPYGKKSRIRTTDLLQKTSLSYRRSCFFGRFFRRSYVWGGVGSQSPGKQCHVQDFYFASCLVMPGCHSFLFIGFLAYARRRSLRPRYPLEHIPSVLESGHSLVHTGCVCAGPCPARAPTGAEFRCGSGTAARIPERLILIAYNMGRYRVAKSTGLWVARCNRQKGIGPST